MQVYYHELPPNVPIVGYDDDLLKATYAISALEGETENVIITELTESEAEGYINTLQQDLYDKDVQIAELQAKNKEMRKKLLGLDGNPENVDYEQDKNDTTRKIGIIAGIILGLILLFLLIRRI